MTDVGPSADAGMTPGADMALSPDGGNAPDGAPAPAADAAPPLPEPTFGLTMASLAHDGGMREYLIYVPASYSADTPTPVILNFHGNGGTARAHLQEADMRPLADRDTVILVYPQGSVLDGESTHWNPLLPSENNKSDADDFGFVAALLDALAANYRIDPSRVYATGYSNGAGLTYGLACYLSDRITAIAPVSGSMYIEMQGNCNPTHPTAVAIFNGTEDGDRPYDGFPGYLLPVDDAAAYWVQHNALSDPPTLDTFQTNGLTVERRLYTDEAGSAGVALFKIIGGQHVWFDIEVEGADQNSLIWDFLSRYDANGRRESP